jgi:SAM-dependent methyltransferase
VLLRPRGKAAFVNSLPEATRLLDVGCGNSSPMQIKMRRPDIYYIGLDVEDYNQATPQEYADEYLLTQPEQFVVAIRKLDRTIDAVISAHNIEHCLDPNGTLDAMLDAVKPRGRIYLSFPCEASVTFPKRKGCLNFHDDISHRTLPKWDEIIAKLHREGFRIDFSNKRYRPPLPALLGLLLEPVGTLTGMNMPIGSTWALYGFESIIWASRISNPVS